MKRILGSNIRTLFLATAATVAVVLAAGCGNSEKPEFPGVPSGAAVVDQDGLKFHPGDLTVDVGTDVYFTNSEAALHSVTVDGENVSGQMERGDVVVWTFDAVGEYEIKCQYHPAMRAVITVE